MDVVQACQSDAVGQEDFHPSGGVLGHSGCPSYTHYMAVHILVSPGIPGLSLRIRDLQRKYHSPGVCLGVLHREGPRHLGTEANPRCPEGKLPSTPMLILDLSHWRLKP